jgi:hypothetical protein
MNDIGHNGGPAFPNSNENGWAAGMTLRDWFAGQSLAWAAHNEWFNQSPEHEADRAYRMADAMLAARAKADAS